MAKKSKKARDCPALSRILTPAECGARRGPETGCPAECAFYPFGIANEAALRKVDADWEEVAIHRLMERVGQAAFQRRVAEQILSMNDRRLETEYAVMNALQLELFFRRDAEGRTEADRWEAEGWTGLNNDLRAMMRHRRNAQLALLEVRRILDGSRAECVDLLYPETPPVVLFGEGQIGAAGRFAVVFGWVIPYPHYHRTAGIALHLTPSLGERLRERILHRHAEARKERPELELRTFLGENLQSIGAEALVMEQGTSGPATGGVMLYQAHYALRAPVDEVTGLIQEAPDFQVATDVESASASEQPFDWNPAAVPGGGDPGGSEADEEAVRLLIVSPERCRVSCQRGPDRDALRVRIEAFLGDRIAFEREEAVDLDAAMAAQNQQRRLVEAAEQSIFNRASGPPEHSVGGEAASSEVGSPEQMRAQYTKLLDESISWLEGKTMREAAKDAALRPRLVQGLKSHIYTIEMGNQRSGAAFDLEWLLEELGIDELK